MHPAEKIETKVCRKVAMTAVLIWGSLFSGRASYSDEVLIDKNLDAFNTEVEAVNRQLSRESKEKITLPRTKRNSLINKDKILDDADLENARLKVLTLKPYLDEVERNLFEKKFDKMLEYLYVIQEQDQAFAILIENLFPTMDPPDIAARESLRFEGKSIFYYTDLLREAARNSDFLQARSAYGRLIYAYDKFLKAGTLYPTYDPISSYDIFYRSVPPDSLKFDRESKINILDRVVMMKGPDMGKTGVLINLEEGNTAKAIVKFDYDGKAYQEVKMIEYSWLAKAAPDPVSKIVSSQPIISNADAN